MRSSFSLPANNPRTTFAPCWALIPTAIAKTTRHRQFSECTARNRTVRVMDHVRYCCDEFCLGNTTSTCMIRWRCIVKVLYPTVDHTFYPKNDSPCLLENGECLVCEMCEIGRLPYAAQRKRTHQSIEPCACLSYLEQ